MQWTCKPPLHSTTPESALSCTPRWLPLFAFPTSQAISPFAVTIVSMQPDIKSPEVIEVSVVSVGLCLILIASSFWQLSTRKKLLFVDAFQAQNITSTVTQVLLYGLWCSIFLCGIATAALFFITSAGKYRTSEFKDGTAYPFTGWRSATVLFAIMFQVCSRFPWL